ncbi:MAG TPA: YajQ family cyclic di-GMP-binding protein [Polyangiaceae bacterium]|nr:YajQ family cyclic di-GMP-binding protein [Polyangiaceae bacterium]
MPSFDIVSKVQWNEVDNALNQAQKEIAQRFDFKDTGTEVEKTAEGIAIRSDSEDRAKAAYKVLEDKLVKRKVSLKHLDVGKIEASGKTHRMNIKVKEGIEVDHAKEIVKRIKDSKIKVQASIQEQQVRVSGKNRDDLQQAIALVRAAGLPVELQFVNFRD